MNTLTAFTTGIADVVGPLIPIVFISLICGVIGGTIGGNREMGSRAGFWWAFLLWMLGILIVAVSARPTQVQRIAARPAGDGWFPDPLGRFDARFFNGNAWTQFVGRVEADGSRRELEDPI